MLMDVITNNTMDYTATPLPPEHIFSRIGEDLTALAANGSLPTVFGREAELDQVIKILGRRAKCNPLILGEAGVGKTTLCHALAHRIVRGEVPSWLAGKKIVRTSFFEIWGSLRDYGRDNDFSEYARTLKHVLQECRQRPVILFMDEFHMLANHPISSNVIKPALADGSLRMIGATTLRDFRVHIEKDEALTRRFIPVTLEEPDREQTRKILLSLKGEYENRYAVLLPDPLIDQVVDLTGIYMQNRNQPDKSIDLLELACIQAASSSSVPGSSIPVTEEVVKEVASSITGIPREIMMGKTDHLTGLIQTLSVRYVGQEEAIRQIANRLVLTKSRMNLEAHRPDGVFLIAGMPGGGKTALAHSLAGLLSPSAEDLLSLDMGVYGDVHSLPVLLGGGQHGPDHQPLLSSHVHTRPSSVLLLENIDVAKMEVLRVLQQIFSSGRMVDHGGREVIFDHVTVLMTTRVGFQSGKTSGFLSDRQDDSWEGQREMILQSVRKHFPSEFLQTVDEVVVLRPFTTEMLGELVRWKAREWGERIGKRFDLADAVIQFFVAEVSSAEAPAHALIRLMDRKMGIPVQRLRQEPSWGAFEGLRFELISGGGIGVEGVV